MEDVGALPLAFLYLDALTDAGVEKVGTPCVFEQGDGLACDDGTLVGHDDEKTAHGEVSVDASLDGGEGIEHVADTIYGQGPKLDGDKYGGGGGKGVEGEDGEGRGTVD